VQAVITARSRKQLPDPGLEVSRGDGVASKDLPAVQTVQNGSYLAGRISRDRFVPAKLPCPGLTHVRFYMCSTVNDCTSGDWMCVQMEEPAKRLFANTHNSTTHTHTFPRPHQPTCWCTHARRTHAGAGNTERGHLPSGWMAEGS
jgi:hypothetical protein